jgi:DNA-directed RNA polymerase subunit RPC12/RpoP
MTVFEKIKCPYCGAEQCVDVGITMQGSLDNLRPSLEHSANKVYDCDECGKPYLVKAIVSIEVKDRIEIFKMEKVKGETN